MKIICALFALVFSTMVSATNLHGMVAFGDSLTDIGNLYKYMNHQLPISPPYYKGRFTNGPVWIEHLIRSYYSKNPRDHLQDYAYGGAVVMTDDSEDEEGFFYLGSEVNSHLAANEGKADPNSLYVMWIGANNYLAMPSDPDPIIKKVIEGTKKNLALLAERGAKQVLVLNLPDLGKTPAAYDFEANDLMSYLALEHNRQLDRTLNELRAQYPKVKWLSLDVNATMSEVFENPASFGFNNTSGTCYDLEDNDKASFSVMKLARSVKAQVSKDRCEGYVFFDPVHPTERAHEILAARAKQVLDAADMHFE